jgi:hypothetical protein
MFHLDPIFILLLFPALIVLISVCAIHGHADGGKIRKGYLSVREMLSELPEPNRAACLRLLEEQFERFRTAPGSTHNHQAWVGGYLDHICEVMNIARLLYATLSAARPLPFTLADAYLVLFLHDLEKPWKYVLGEDELQNPELADKHGRMGFRLAKAAEYGIVLTEDHLNGMEFAEGENHKYSNRHRYMGRLAAFCHLCDVWSARGWHDHPLAENDLWGAERHGKK